MPAKREEWKHRAAVSFCHIVQNPIMLQHSWTSEPLLTPCQVVHGYVQVSLCCLWSRGVWWPAWELPSFWNKGLSIVRKYKGSLKICSRSIDLQVETATSKSWSYTVCSHSPARQPLPGPDRVASTSGALSRLNLKLLLSSLHFLSIQKAG